MLTISDKGRSSVPLLEPGTYPAICCQIIDLGQQFNETYHSTARKVLIGWEVIGETVEVNGETQPRIFSKIYTASLNEKAALRRDLNAWRGRPFTAQELAAFDLKAILGAPCLISVIHQTGQTGNTYATLASISKPPKGYPFPAQSVPSVTYDIEADDPAKVDELPKWIGEMIRRSGSYEERVAQTAAPKIEEYDGDDDGEGDLPF